MVAFLIQIEQEDEDKNTPLGIAMMYSHPAVAIVLIEKGANIHHPLNKITYHLGIFSSPLLWSKYSPPPPQQNYSPYKFLLPPPKKKVSFLFYCFVAELLVFTLRTRITAYHFPVYYIFLLVRSCRKSS
jgi:hypothetical protein